MAGKRKAELSQDINGREAMGSDEVMQALSCSKSHLYRLMTGQISGLASPFPRPFHIGRTKPNLWRRSQIVAFIDAEQASAE
jgi:predicted DNA-binding transcriptional regulator AlpA